MLSSNNILNKNTSNTMTHRHSTKFILEGGRNHLDILRYYVFSFLLPGRGHQNKSVARKRVVVGLFFFYFFKFSQTPTFWNEESAGVS